jgi:hypothetical protein
MISHHFVEVDELISKMYTVWVFEIIFHKIIEENWKIFVFETQKFLDLKNLKNLFTKMYRI